MPPENLERSYRIVRELDPYHPVTVVFMAPRRAAEYAAGMDVVMTDPLSDSARPAGLGVGCGARGGRRLRTRQARLARAAGLWRQRVVDSRAHCPGTARHDLPGHRRRLHWDSVFHPPRPEWVPEVSYNVGRLQSGGAGGGRPYSRPVVARGQTRRHLVSGLGVRVAAWRHRGVITVIAVNTENRPLTIQLILENVEFSGEADVLFEDRAIQVTPVPARSRTALSALLLPAALLTRPFRGPELSAIWPRTIVDDIIDAYGIRIYSLPVDPVTADGADPNPHNLILDPSFEWSPSPGTPAAVYASVAEERGATYFVDTRVALHGDQSLRLHTPKAGQGVTIAPYAPTVSEGRAYRLAVWAKASAAGPVPALKLGIGNAVGGREGVFELSSEWRPYTLDGTMAPGATRAALSVSLETPGTAWVDLLQLYDISPRISSQAMPSGGFTVVLENYLRDAQLRYTLDGADPGVDSPLYTRPFHVSRDVDCKVRRVQRRHGHIDFGAQPAPARGYRPLPRSDLPLLRALRGRRSGRSERRRIWQHVF